MPTAADALALDGVFREVEDAQRRALYNAIDQALQQTQGDMRQIVQARVAERQRAAMVAMRDELERAQPSMVDTVIAATLDNMSGLVGWICDNRKQQDALADFEALLVVYMEYLEIAMARGPRLENRIDDLRDALQILTTSTDDLCRLVHRVNWACYDVRTIGNARSPGTLPLSDAEILELCGCFSALGAAMPTLALELKPSKPEVAAHSDASAPSTITNLASADVRLALINQLLAGSSNGSSAGVDAERLLQLLTAGLSNGANGASSATPPVPAATTTTMPSNPASIVPGNYATTTSRNDGYGVTTDQAPPLDSGSPPLQSPVPPGFAPVTELDRTRMVQFARMINHMKVVPKANLCPFSPDHDAICPRSHSYLEVMRYNPLFKRFRCRQLTHYWSKQVADDDKCVCIHVDTGLTLECLGDKRSYCPSAATCKNTKCMKSHSFEELCWYNPHFKVRPCVIRGHEHIARGRGKIAPPLECNYYHIEDGPNADMRQPMVEDDYVGKNLPMLFIERTHKPLADALEALRYARAHNL